MPFDSASIAAELTALHQETQRQRMAVDAIEPQTPYSRALALQLLSLETAYMNAAEAVEAITSLPKPVIPLP